MRWPLESIMYDAKSGFTSTTSIGIVENECFELQQPRCAKACNVSMTTYRRNAQVEVIHNVNCNWSRNQVPMTQTTTNKFRIAFEVIDEITAALTLTEPITECIDSMRDGDDIQ